MSGKTSVRYECINKEFKNENGINYYIYTYKYPSTKGKKDNIKIVKRKYTVRKNIEREDKQKTQ